MQGEFEARLRPLIESELYFAQVVCNLTKEQQAAIRVAGDACLKDVSQNLLMSQQFLQGVFNSLGLPMKLEPRKRIQQELAKSFKNILSAEQMTMFDEECERRNASRQLALAQNLVAKLDKALILSADQRDKLSVRLFANWTESWENSLQTWQDNEDYFPDIPDKYVAPLLNPEQRLVWSELHKIGADELDFEFEQELWNAGENLVDG